MMTLNDLFGPPVARVVTCEACGKVTREGKPVCPDHLDRLPYVAEIIVRVDELKDSVDRLAREYGPLPPRDGVLAGELRSILVTHGEASTERVRHELPGSCGAGIVQSRLVTWMPEVPGVVSIGKTRRGLALWGLKPPA